MSTEKSDVVVPLPEETSWVLIAEQPHASSLTHPLIQDGWFLEKESPQWPGQRLALQVTSLLHVSRSTYQDILVFQSSQHGRVLVLDGAVQLTERDECAYHECMAMVPLQVHPNPKRVCVVGGGDGGVVRAVLQDPRVAHVTLCEVDADVLRVCRTYFPSLAHALDDPKVTVHVGDGMAFLADVAAAATATATATATTPATQEPPYDVIITDSSDFDGPAAPLFAPAYYTTLANALAAPHGIFCSQGECYWLHLAWLARTHAHLRSVFPATAYASVPVPTYPCGTIGLLLGSLDASQTFQGVLPLPPGSGASSLLFTDPSLPPPPFFRFYNRELHPTLFQLPTFVQTAFREAWEAYETKTKKEGRQQPPRDVSNDEVGGKKEKEQHEESHEHGAKQPMEGKTEESKAWISSSWLPKTNDKQKVVNTEESKESIQTPRLPTKMRWEE